MRRWFPASCSIGSSTSLRPIDRTASSCYNVGMNTRMTMEEYLNLSPQDQIRAVEQIMIELWEEGLLDLVGFDASQQPLFVVKGVQ